MLLLLLMQRICYLLSQQINVGDLEVWIANSLAVTGFEWATARSVNGQQQLASRRAAAMVHC
jgi:hypothetical protein